MDSVLVGRRSLLAVGAVLAVAWLALAAPAPDTDQDLRKQALKLNDVTGDEPIKGQIEALAKEPAVTKKLLAAAQAMAKEKEQPFNYTALYILGGTALKLKEYPTSEAFYRLAAKQALELKSASKVAEVYRHLIDLLYVTKKYGESEKLCKELLSIPGDESLNRVKVVVLERLIQVYAKQEKFDDANKLLDNLLKAEPENWLLLDLKAGVQREAGQFAESAKTYEDVLDKLNKDKELTKEQRNDFVAEIRYSLSNVYLDLNKLDKVTEHLEALIALDPNSPTYQNDLGYIWADHDMNLEKAEKLIRSALDLDRKQRKEAKVNPEEDHDNGAYLDSLAWVLFKEKKYKEAKEVMLRAIKDTEGQHIEIYDHLGDIHLALGEKADALVAWKKGITLAGDSKREKQRKIEVEKKVKANQ